MKGELLDCLKEDGLLAFGPADPMRIALDLFGLILKQEGILAEEEEGKRSPVLLGLNEWQRYEFLEGEAQVVAKYDTEPNKQFALVLEPFIVASLVDTLFIPK